MHDGAVNEAICFNLFYFTLMQQTQHIFKKNRPQQLSW